MVRAICCPSADCGSELASTLLAASTIITQLRERSSSVKRTPLMIERAWFSQSKKIPITPVTEP
ncbi:arsenic metallochaperone ArsD family protein [Pseudomonas sp. MYb118]|uniref:arsenic metallochaperone ArsD family protein n=1 Tax=Pseudomonas sp. MYb118 TaxID=1848720 RepID=UPI0034D018E2